MSFWDNLTGELESIGTTVGEWVPKIVGALIILLVGWFIAKWVRRIVRRLLDNERVSGFFDRIGIGEALRNAGYSASSLVASAVYGFLMLVVLLIAFEALELTEVTDLLRRLIAFLPQIFIALVIVMIAAGFGRFVADLTGPWAESRQMTWVPTAIRVGFLLFGVITALDLLDVGVVTNSVLAAVLGGLGIAFAIAFGIGGIDTAKQWWAKYAAPRSGSSTG